MNISPKSDSLEDPEYRYHTGYILLHFMSKKLQAQGENNHKDLQYAKKKDITGCDRIPH